MRRSLVIAGTALAVTAASAHAQGSSVLTHSSCSMARGGAGVAAPCADGSAILFSPAALTMQPSTIGLGVAGITQEREFTFDATGERLRTDAETTQVPYGYASYRFSERLAAGIGVFAPYGAGIEWPLEFEGRFVSYDSDLRNIYIQPTVAFQAAPWLSVGAGVDVVRASIEINQRLDLATTPTGALNPVTGAPLTFGNLGVPLGTDFAEARLEGNGTGYGFHLGAIARFSDRFSVGARYLSSVEIDYEGDATFSAVPTGLTLAAGNPLRAPAGTPVDLLIAPQFTSGSLVNQGLATSLTLPDQLVVGVAVRPVPALQLMADYQWTGWEKFDEAPIDFETSTDQVLVLDYQNTDTWRLGAEFAATNALALRAGFIYNTAAEREFSVSPLLPEAERNYYTAGIGYRLANGLGIDVGYQYIDQSDRRGRVRGREPGLSEAQLRALNVGVYSVDASVLGITLSYHLGGR
ncbi:MAG TPA: outer membrane protein transport protein [Longimicrobiaceae bacterium]|nr:outer membrane protein transport protein [Longimicrobiaceae bacterium]